jgi:hypothetical protein
MSYIKDPKGGALWVDPQPLTPEEEEMVHAYIAEARKRRTKSGSRTQPGSSKREKMKKKAAAPTNEE